MTASWDLLQKEPLCPHLQSHLLSFLLQPQTTSTWERPAEERALRHLPRSPSPHDPVCRPVWRPLNCRIPLTCSWHVVCSPQGPTAARMGANAQQHLPDPGQFSAGLHTHKVLPSSWPETVLPGKLVLYQNAPWPKPNSASVTLSLNPRGPDPAPLKSVTNCIRALSSDFPLSVPRLSSGHAKTGAVAASSFSPHPSHCLILSISVPFLVFLATTGVVLSVGEGPQFSVSGGHCREGLCLPEVQGRAALRTREQGLQVLCL